MNCPKCGYEVTGVFWHPDDRHRHDMVDPCRENHACAFDDLARPLDEHLHMRCRCGYDWTTPTLDAAGQPDVLVFSSARP